MSDIEERAKKIQESDSFLAIVKSCLLYVINDLRKKKRQFAIGISTIFLTVTVVTFLHSLIRLAPAVTMIASQSTVGDYDLMLSKGDEKNVRIKGNRNFYFEGEEFFE